MGLLDGLWDFWGVLETLKDFGGGWWGSGYLEHDGFAVGEGLGMLQLDGGPVRVLPAVVEGDGDIHHAGHPYHDGFQPGGHRVGWREVGVTPASVWVPVT